jgi:hypothetical protein
MWACHVEAVTKLWVKTSRVKPSRCGLYRSVRLLQPHQTQVAPVLLFSSLFLSPLSFTFFIRYSFIPFKMRRALLLSLAPIVLGCNNPASHACASAYTASSSAAAAFCATFTASVVTATTGLPSFASACDFKTMSLSSACSCLDTAWATTGSGVSLQ